MSNIRFNINNYVNVKLTQKGLDILKQQERKVVIDVDGYTKFQLWDLMGIFGHTMQFPSFTIPFETYLLLNETDLEKEE